MKYLFFFFTLHFAGYSFAQGSDYIIDINDRKVYGTVKLSNPALNSSQIKFKDNTTGSVQQYRPDQIKSWSNGKVTYEAKVYTINDRKAFSVFMLRHTPENGKVHLYEYYNTSGDVGYTQYFLERDKKMTEVEYGRFRKQMTEYFKDNEELSKKIANKKYKKKDLLDIIEEYNQWREYLWR